MVEPEPQSHAFTSPELARLATYRAAVFANFYTDWDGSESTDLNFFDSIKGQPAGDEGFPFNPDEWDRLGRYRAAVAARYYTDETQQTLSTESGSPSQARMPTDDDYLNGGIT